MIFKKHQICICAVVLGKASYPRPCVIIDILPNGFLTILPITTKKYDSANTFLIGEIDSDFKAMYLRQAKVVESILKEGARKSAIRPVRTEQAALAISDVIRGVVTQRVLGWSKSKISRDVDFIFDLIWKGIAA